MRLFSLAGRQELADDVFDPGALPAAQFRPVERVEFERGGVARFLRLLAGEGERVQPMDPPGQRAGRQAAHVPTHTAALDPSRHNSRVVNVIGPLFRPQSR